jgi:hypothetical protein
MQMYRSYQSAIKKQHIALNTHNNKHQLQSNTAGYGWKTH